MHQQDYWPVTKKPNEKRIGKGKANVKYWCFAVRPGQNLVEIKGVFKAGELRQKLNKLRKNISVKTTILSKADRWIL